jgi:hypothetical protein
MYVNLSSSPAATARVVVNASTPSTELRRTLLALGSAWFARSMRGISVGAFSAPGGMSSRPRSNASTGWSSMRVRATAQAQAASGGSCAAGMARSAAAPRGSRATPRATNGSSTRISSRCMPTSGASAPRCVHSRGAPSSGRVSSKKAGKSSNERGIVRRYGAQGVAGAKSSS